jgi:hypothetical protein
MSDKKELDEKFEEYELAIAEWQQSVAAEKLAIEELGKKELKRVLKSVISRPYNEIELRTNEEKEVFRLDEIRNELYTKMTAMTMDILQLVNKNEKDREAGNTGDTQ